MSDWTDRFSRHHSGVVLRDVSDQLESLLVREDLPSEHIEGLQRLSQVVLHTKRRFSSLDPNLVSPAMLERLATRLQALKEPLVLYGAQPSAALLDQANACADSLLDSFYELTGILTAEDAGDLRDAIVSLRQSVGQHIRRASDEVARLEESVQATRDRAEALTKEIAAREGRLDELISRVNDQHTSAQATRASEFVAFLTSRTTEWQDGERQRTESFTVAQAARVAEWGAKLSAMDDALASNVEELKKKANEATRVLADKYEAWDSTTTADGKATLHKLEEFRAKAENLVGIMGKAGMVHGYQEVANEAGKQRRFWVWVAAGALVGLILSGLVLQSPVLEMLGLSVQPANWESFATRVFLSLTFLALAVFGGNQASRLEQVERRNRQIELELAALGPFLADLTQVERNDIVKQVADRMFGQNIHSVDLTRDVKLPVEAAMDLAKQAITLLNKKA